MHYWRVVKECLRSFTIIVFKNESESYGQLLERFVYSDVSTAGMEPLVAVEAAMDTM